MAGQRGVRGLWPNINQQGETDALRRALEDIQTLGASDTEVTELPVAGEIWAGRTVHVFQAGAASTSWICKKDASGKYKWYGLNTDATSWDYDEGSSSTVYGSGTIDFDNGTS